MLRIRIIFLYCACVLLTGCGKINDVKTDSVNNYSYKIEDLVTFPVNDSNSYIDVLEDMIVYNDSGQRIVLTNNIGKSEKELFDVDSNKSICSFGIDSNDNLLIITKGEDSTDSQYEWIEINENEELVGTGNIDGVTYLSNRRLSQVISADCLRRKYLSQSAVNELKAFCIGWYCRLSRVYFSSDFSGLK